MVMNGPVTDGGCQLRKVLAVIPAKLTSVRIPRKNLEKLLELELFLFSVRAAQLAASVDRVVVSSESTELLELAGRYGAQTVLRPAELSGERVTNQAVIGHVVEQMRACEGWSADLVVLLQPTHPFRVPADINDAVAALCRDPDADSVFAVKQDKGLFGRMSGELFVPDVALPRVRDKEERRFVNTGNFYILNVARTIDRGVFFGHHILGFPISRPDLEIDIDEPIDLAVARAMAEFYEPELRKLGLLEGRQ